MGTDASTVQVKLAGGPRDGYSLAVPRDELPPYLVLSSLPEPPPPPTPGEIGPSEPIELRKLFYRLHTIKENLPDGYRIRFVYCYEPDQEPPHGQKDDQENHEEGPGDATEAQLQRILDHTQ